MGDSGFESWQGQEIAYVFSASCLLAGGGSFAGGKEARGIVLTPHFYPQPRLRLECNYPGIPSVCLYSVRRGNLAFTFYESRLMSVYLRLGFVTARALLLR